MEKIASADLTGKLDWFGSFRFVAAEWWEGTRLVLLRYAYRGGQIERLGVRLDLDKRAILDDVEDETINAQIHKKAPDIWAVVAKEYATKTGATR